MSIRQDRLAGHWQVANGWACSGNFRLTLRRPPDTPRQIPRTE